MAENSERNTYCERLRLPVPRLEDVVGQHRIRLFHLMLVALLEHGGPVGLDDLAGRLRTAGVVAVSGDLTLSLQRAWHGMEPVYRDAQGRFGLNLSSTALEHILRALGLRAPRFAPPLPPPPEPVEAADEIPLSADELDVAFRGRSLFGLSSLRQAAAVLDVLGGHAGFADVDAFLARLTRYRASITATSVRYWRSALVAVDEDARLTLNRAAPDLGPMRRAVRKLARSTYVQRAHGAYWAQIGEAREAVLAEERRQQTQGAAPLRRAILRVVPGPEHPQAIALLDVSARSIRTLIGDSTAAIQEALFGFDLLAGLQIRETLHGLCSDPDRWRLVDLNPPRKKRRLNRAGRTLTITPELLIWGTTGISRPLGDPEKVAQYLASGDVRRLTRRLESDAKALHALYSYGILHNGVRLRWGFLDEILGVDWAVPGDAHLYDMLKKARQASVPVDLVVGSAPGWADPWSRARRVDVVDIEPWVVIVRQGTEKMLIDYREIQAIRMVGVGCCDAG